MAFEAALAFRAVVAEVKNRIHPRNDAWQRRLTATKKKYSIATERLVSARIDYEKATDARRDA
ncbi:hypothetical protein IIC65_06425, partial [Candidatus Sumerlaeota bacterium]|nr:hypothetical protein [Candidatus Sumerlaeota bacterium]